VIDLDVQKFFDTVPWDRIIAAVEANTRAALGDLVCEAVAGRSHPDARRHAGSTRPGNPAGIRGQPVLANLFMHYAFDLWLGREFPGCPFERYADDGVVHCRTKAQAEAVLAALRDRMEPGRRPTAPPQDQDRVLQGRQAPRCPRAHGVHLPRVHLPGQGGARQERERVHRVRGPAASKDAIKKMSERVRVLAGCTRLTGHTIGEIAPRGSTRGNPGVDAVLTALSTARNCIRSSAASIPIWCGGCGEKYRRLRPFKKAHAAWKRVTSQYPRCAVRALAVGPRILVRRMRRARWTGRTVTPGSAGARGRDPPGPPDRAVLRPRPSVTEKFEFIDAEYAAYQESDDKHVPSIVKMCRWIEGVPVRVLRMAERAGIGDGEKARDNRTRREEVIRRIR